MKDYKCPYCDNANFNDATNPNEEVRQTNTNKTKIPPITPIFDSLRKIYEKIERQGSVIDFNQCYYNDKVELILGDNHEIKVEEGKTYVVKKQPKYPTTYEDCCKILRVNALAKLELHTDADYIITEREQSLFRLTESFYKLRMCRDAYWKIAGEQMGLGKSWEPNWDNFGDYYCIVNKYGKLHKDDFLYLNHILAFPTTEMRDTFYENFKDLIEQCKELL